MALEIGKWYSVDIDGKTSLFSVINILADKDRVCINMHRGLSIVWVAKSELDSLNPVEIESPHKDALKKALTLKVGDKVHYLTKGIMGVQYTLYGGEILEIWGNVKDHTYSFKISCDDSWYHIYPGDIVWPDELEQKLGGK
jgi:hypothetical protein